LYFLNNTLVNFDENFVFFEHEDLSYNASLLLLLTELSYAMKPNRSILFVPNFCFENWYIFGQFNFSACHRNVIWPAHCQLLKKWNRCFRVYFFTSSLLLYCYQHRLIYNLNKLATLLFFSLFFKCFSNKKRSENKSFTNPFFKMSVNESSKPYCSGRLVQQLKNYAVICCYLRSANNLQAGENIISSLQST